MRKSCLSLLLFLWVYAGALQAACSTTIDVAVREIGWTLVLNQDGRVEGVVPDVLNEASRMTGCPVNYLNVPLARAYLMLRYGQIDIIPAAIRNPERDEFATHVASTLTPVLLVSLRDSPVKINTFDKLSAARIRVDLLRGANYGPAYDAWRIAEGARGLVDEMTNYDVIVQRLSLGRSQAFISPLAAIAASVERHGMQDKLHMEVLHELPATLTGFYFSKSTPGQPDVVKFRQTVEELIKRGEYFRLINKHYPVWAKQGILPAPLK